MHYVKCLPRLFMLCPTQAVRQYQHCDMLLYHKQVVRAGLMVAIFQHCPQLQSTLMEEVLTQVLPCLPMGRRCPRTYMVGDDKSASVQVIVAMLVQMIQVSIAAACLIVRVMHHCIWIQEHLVRVHVSTW